MEDACLHAGDRYRTRQTDPVQWPGLPPRRSQNLT